MKKLLSTFIIGAFLLTGCSSIDETSTEDKELDKSPTVEESSEPKEGDAKETTKDDTKEPNKEDTNTKDKNVDKEVEDGKFTEEMLIEKAIETLYEQIGKSPEEVTFVHNQNESYVKENNIKNKYYIFNEVSNINTDYETISDYNLLVDKDTFEVYMYSPVSGLENYYEEDRFSEEMLIEKAIETLYYKTGENSEEVAFVHNQDESYVKEESIKNQYYIFNMVQNIGTEYETIRDYNMLVHKDTYDIYMYSPEFGLEHFSR